MDINGVLQELGLTDKEINTYLKLIELGKTSVQRLSEITGINRVTLYSILESLIKKGMAGSTIIESSKHFYTIDPDKILEQLEERKKRFKEIIPILKEKIQTIGLKPEVQFYEGVKGIIAVESDVLNTKKEFFAYGSFDIYNKILKYTGISFRKKRIAKKLKVTAITDSSAVHHELFEKEEYQKYSKLIILESLRNMPSWTYIYNNKVAIISFEKENPNIIVIDSKPVYEKEKMVFELLWKIAKK